MKLTKGLASNKAQRNVAKEALIKLLERKDGRGGDHPPTIGELAEWIPYAFTAKDKKWHLDSWNNTPMHYAVSTGCLKIMKWLQEQGCPIDSACKYGVSPLVNAVSNGDIETFEWLLDQGANPMVHSYYDKSLLHTAMRQDRSYIVRRLLDLGVDPDSTDSFGIGSLTAALAQHGRQKHISLLLEYGVYIAPKYLSTGRLLDHCKPIAARFNEWKKQADASELTAEDIIGFANIGVLDEVFKPQIWKDHKAHCEQLLAALPAAVSQRFVSKYPPVAQMLANPAVLVQGASATYDSAVSASFSQSK